MVHPFTISLVGFPEPPQSYHVVRRMDFKTEVMTVIEQRHLASSRRTCHWVED